MIVVRGKIKNFLMGRTENSYRGKELGQVFYFENKITAATQ